MLLAYALGPGLGLTAAPASPAISALTPSPTQAATPTPSASTITYTYDRLNRLTRVEYRDGTSIAYTYDAVGNRTGMKVTTPLIATTSSLPPGREGDQYWAALEASGGTPPYTWSLDSGSLPPGLSLGRNGAVSGTPLRRGTYQFTVKVTDASFVSHTGTVSLMIESRSLSLNKAAKASYSYPGADPSLALDGNSASYWVGGEAPAWLEVDLGGAYTVGSVELLISQSPPGETEHQVWVTDSLGQGRLAGTLAGYTLDDQTLYLSFKASLGDVAKVKVLTTRSPSWVAWREVRVFPPDTGPAPMPVEPPAGATNVAQGKPAKASLSYPGTQPSHAVDGDANSMWVGGPAPAWYEVDLQGAYRIEGLQLLVSQSPSGSTTHEVWVTDTSGQDRLVQTLSGYTRSGQTLAATFSPALENVSKVRIRTTASPSWVAWKEVRVFGTQTGMAGKR